MEQRASIDASTASAVAQHDKLCSRHSHLNPTKMRAVALFVLTTYKAILKGQNSAKPDFQAEWEVADPTLASIDRQT